MASFVLKKRLMLAGGADISAQMQQGNFQRGRRGKDSNAWGDNTRTQAPGNLFGTMDGSGLTSWAADDVDQRLERLFGLKDKVYMMSAAEGLEGEQAMVLKALLSKYNGFEVDKAKELYGFSYSLLANDHFIGTIGDVDTNLTATGNGNGYQLGAVTAANKEAIFAAIFVRSVTGTSPTLDAKVVSDPANTFLATTDRITFSQLTDASGENSDGVHALYGRFVPTSDITDQWWRFQFTVAGTTPVFDVVTVLGVEGPAV